MKHNLICLKFLVQDESVQKGKEITKESFEGSERLNVTVVFFEVLGQEVNCQNGLWKRW